MIHATDQIGCINGRLTHSNKFNKADVLNNDVTASAPRAARIHKETLSLTIKGQCGIMLFWGVLELTRLRIETSTETPPAMWRSIMEWKSLTRCRKKKRRIFYVERLFDIRNGLIGCLTPNTLSLWISDEHPGKLMNKWGAQLCIRNTKASRKCQKP